jgi:predicted hydrolase (HD superfamily)
MRLHSLGKIQETVMDNCVIRNNLNAETRALYGVLEDVVYKAEDGAHEKDGTTIVHLTAPDGAKIDIPVNLVLFLSAFSKYAK